MFAQETRRQFRFNKSDARNIFLRESIRYLRREFSAQPFFLSSRTRTSARRCAILLTLRVAPAARFFLSSRTRNRQSPVTRPRDVAIFSQFAVADLVEVGLFRGRGTGSRPSRVRATFKYLAPTRSEDINKNNLQIILQKKL